jgi:hypothetical protein
VTSVANVIVKFKHLPPKSQPRQQQKRKQSRTKGAQENLCFAQASSNAAEKFSISYDIVKKANILKGRGAGAGVCVRACVHPLDI